MFRYRCPHCRQILQALEIRAGKTTICSKCSKALTIPADRAEWLDAAGNPLPAIAPAAAETPIRDPDPFLLLDSHEPIMVGDPVIPPYRPEPPAPPAVVAAEETVVRPKLPPLAPPPPVPATPQVAAVKSEPKSRTKSLIDIQAEAAAEPDGEVTLFPPPRESKDPTPIPKPAAEVPVEKPEPAPPVVAKAEEQKPAPPPPKPEARKPAPPPPPEVKKPEPKKPKAPPPEPVEPPKRAEPSKPPEETRVIAPVPPSEPTPAPPAPPARPVQPREPARPRRTVAAVPAPPPRPPEPTRAVARASAPAVAHDSDPELPPVGLRPVSATEQQDLATALTAVLTTRMKPPPTPPRDLRPSTAVWLVLTGLAVALLVLALVTSGDYLRWVGYLGLALMLCGYAWIVRLAWQREPKRGVAAAVPLFTIWFLGQRKYGKYRPLRFVATGAVLIAVAGAATLAQPKTRKWAGAPAAAEQPPPPAVDVATLPRVEQLRAYRDRKSYDALIDLLRGLSQSDPTKSAGGTDPRARAALAAELRGLCGHHVADVKTEALAAFARWDDSAGQRAARDMCLAAARNGSDDEKLMALLLLPRWKDAETARAVASRIGDPSTETSRARDALVELGGKEAEAAAIPLLRDDRANVRLTAISVLGADRVGGPDAVAALAALARDTESPRFPKLNDPATRLQARQTAEAIQARLQKK